MNDTVNPEEASQPTDGVSLADLIVDLNFVPAWARDSARREVRDSVDADRPSQKERGRRDRGPRFRGPREGGAQRRPQAQRRDAAESAPASLEPDLPIRVRFVPERQAIGVAARDLHVSRRAASLFRLAQAFCRARTPAW